MTTQAELDDAHGTTRSSVFQPHGLLLTAPTRVAALLFGPLPKFDDGVYCFVVGPGEATAGWPLEHLFTSSELNDRMGKGDPIALLFHDPAEARRLEECLERERLTDLRRGDAPWRALYQYVDYD